MNSFEPVNPIQKPLQEDFLNIQKNITEAGSVYIFI